MTKIRDALRRWQHQQRETQLPEICAHLIMRLSHCLFYALQPHCITIFTERGACWPMRCKEVQQFALMGSLVHRWMVDFTAASVNPTELSEEQQLLWISETTAKPIILKELEILQFGGPILLRESGIRGFWATEDDRKNIASTAIMAFEQSLLFFHEPGSLDKDSPLTNYIRQVISDVHQNPLPALRH